MNSGSPASSYDFSAKTIAITGGGGVLCGALAKALAACHANVVILDRDLALGERTVAELGGTKGKHKAMLINVLEKDAVDKAADAVVAEYGRVDGLINGAGGNSPLATKTRQRSGVAWKDSRMVPVRYSWVMNTAPRTIRTVSPLGNTLFWHGYGNTPSAALRTKTSRFAR